MSLMFTFLLVIQILSALAIVVLVLLQQGKGADMGSAFGGGSAGSLFGATGAANFLSRSTKWAAIVFFVSTAALAYAGSRPVSGVQDGGVMDSLPVDLSVPSIPGAAAPSDVPEAPVAPAAPAEPAASAPAAAADTPAEPPAAAAEGSTPAAQ
ncbi:MAG: preprotein translocase subunit SecG [Pigmentiphaga sp.]|nr:preprotein translocase subunit SecG [Pigmentiphaga sp.]